MIEIIFKLLQKPETLVDVGSISPSTITKLSIDKIKSLPIKYGSRTIKIEEIFEVDSYNFVQENAENIKIIFIGSGIEKLWFVGRNMDKGVIEVHGDVGPFAGYEMKGGNLIVKGNAREWLGASMKGGIIEVYKNADDFVGSKPFFDIHNGMGGGKIIIHGNAKNYVGLGMCRGYIEILGSAGDFVGFRMNGGVIVIHKSCGIYPGLEMSNGLIVIRGNVESIDIGFENMYTHVTQNNCRKIFKIFVGDKIVNGSGAIILLDMVY